MTLRGVDPQMALELARREQRYALWGLIIGGVVIGVGLVMIFLHIAGQVSLDIRAGSTRVRLDTALVGVVIGVVGGIIIWLTRSKVKIEGTKVTPKEPRPKKKAAKKSAG